MRTFDFEMGRVGHEEYPKQKSRKKYPGLGKVYSTPCIICTLKGRIVVAEENTIFA